MNNNTTLKDIAKKFGVSITTISKALNDHPDIPEEKRNKIKKAAIQMRYIPDVIAKSLRSRSTRFIGLVISDNTNPYYASLIKGVEEELTSNNYHIIMFNTSENPEKEFSYINDLVSIRIAGIIITPAMGNDKSIEVLQHYNIPYVLANRYINKNKDNYVIADDFKAGFIAGNYLLKKNRKTVFLNSFEEISSARDRLNGFISAHKKNGLEVTEDNIYYGLLDQNDGYNATKDVIKKNKKPLSILCYSDYVATGVLKKINEEGIKIPESVSVMGIDNTTLFSFINPGLTTVSIPKEDIGKACAKIIMYQIENPKNIAKRLILEPKLIVRGTA